MTKHVSGGPQEDGWNDGDFFCAFVLGGLILSCACMLIAHFADGSGTAAEWVSALATAAALGFAALAARAAYRGLSIERARDIARDDQDRRSQAELISGWVSEVSTTSIDGTLVGVSGWTVTLRNGSSLPVFRVRGVAYFQSSSGTRDPSVDFSVAVLAPGDTPSVAPSVGPGAYIPLEQFGVGAAQIPEVLRVDLKFTDHRGLRWWRRGDGVIEFLGEED